jgi:peptidyl-prolyl cis-trans isomerase SurA
MKKAIVVLAAFVALAPVVRADVIEQVLVKVNGEIFTKTDLENRQVAKLREQGQRIDLKAEAANEQLKKLLDQITPQLMVDAIDEMLLVQRGRELGYKLTDEQFKSIVENIRKENKLESQEQFDAALKQENLTLNDLRKNIERGMIIQRVQQAEVMSKIALTDEEARAYYDAHVKEFTSPATITLREILVAVPNTNAAADEQGRLKAEEIRRRLGAGEDFEKVAAEVSEAASRTNSGVVGPISFDDLAPELRKVFDPMKPGDITQPLRGPRGYEIYKVESVTATQVMPFEQARDRISERVVTGKRQEELDKYLARLRAEAIIDWKNPEIKKAYEEGLKENASKPAPAPPAEAPAKTSATRG